MFRRLLNIASIICLVACVLLMGIWVRSDYVTDGITERFTAPQTFSIMTIPGCVFLLHVREDLTSYGVNPSEMPS
jgi:hypothetical protein